MASEPWLDIDELDLPTGGTPVAEQWGQYVHRNLRRLYSPPCVCVERTTDQLVSNATLDVVDFNAADRWDTDGFHNPASTNHRIVVPQGLAGRYRVMASMQWQTNAVGNRVAYILVNGATSRWEDDDDGEGGNRLQVAGEVVLNEGHFIELGVYQDSGGSINLLRALLAMEWLGPIP